jgi:hypothetical protein
VAVAVRETGALNPALSWSLTVTVGPVAPSLSKTITTWTVVGPERFTATVIVWST